jgi:aspartyl-tRNA(Asn)/glutamyl-tRNA(Gln) amidotransferase subunit C
MSVSREEALRIAQLAEMDVEDEALPAVAEQLSRILDYVAQLKTVAAGENARPFIAGPDTVRFRPDEVKPQPLARSPKDMAPAFREGFYVVPRLGQFDEGAAEQ